jgi:hypothetical protein
MCTERNTLRYYDTWIFGGTTIACEGFEDELAGYRSRLENKNINTIFVSPHPVTGDSCKYEIYIG